METISNPSLSKLCRKNPNRNVVGWYKMSFVVYFEFCLSWFWFGRKFPVKMAKTGHLCFLLDTFRLGEPEGPKIPVLASLR